MTFLLGDVPGAKNALNPDMLAAWERRSTAKHGCTRRKLVANLPYVIATPLVSNLLVSGTDIERMVVMVQWEIGERMRASAGYEGLQRDERAGAEPGRRGAGAEGAADQLLPPAEGRFGDRA